jgi:hypothetical protein
VVIVSVKVPVKPAGGVNSVLGSVASTNVPPTEEVHIILEAVPPKFPFSRMLLSIQIGS